MLDISLMPIEIDPEKAIDCIQKIKDSRANEMNKLYGNFLTSVRKYKENAVDSQIKNNLDDSIQDLQLYFGNSANRNENSDDILQLLETINNKIHNYHSLMYESNNCYDNILKCKVCEDIRESGENPDYTNCPDFDYDPSKSGSCKDIKAFYEERQKFYDSKIEELDNDLNRLRNLIRDYCHPVNGSFEKLNQFNQKIERLINKENTINSYPQ